MDIFEACQEGNIDCVRAALEDGIDINSEGLYGDTPLTNAIWYGHLDIVTLLVTRGADMEKGSNSWNALHAAVNSDRIEMVQYLLAAGADVNHAAIQTHVTPLHVACRHASAATIVALVSAGAAVNAKDHNGETPLRWIANINYTTWENKMTLLLDAGANMNAQALDGDTILHHAVRNNNIDKVRYLLSHGARVDIQNAQGQIAMDLTTEPEMTSLLESYDPINDVKNAARRK